MKMSFGPPLALGYTSEAEYFDMTLDTPFNSSMVSSLNEALPDGFFVVTAGSILSAKITISSKVNLAVYEAILDKNADYQDKIDKLMGRETVEIERESKGNKKTVDIRSAVKSLKYNPETGMVVLELGVGQAGYARPTEVIEAAGLVPVEEVPAIPIHRKEIYFVTSDGERLTPLEF